LLFLLTLNMQAPKASDSPQHKKRGTAADLRIRLSQDWPRVGTASPPKRENILTPQKATYKGGKPASWLSMLSILCHFHGLLWKRVSQNHNHREGPFWEQEPLVRDDD
jgi:hypothetical protein